MMNTENIRVREEYIKRLRAELLGPGSEFSIPDAEHEIISSNPSERYTIGILYPPKIKWGIDNEEVQDETEENEQIDYVDLNSDEVTKNGERMAPGHANEMNECKEGGLDEDVGMSTQYLPSSMGITFFVTGQTDSINGTISFGTYRNASQEDCIIPLDPPDPDVYEIPEALRGMIEYDRDRGVAKLIRYITGKEVREAEQLVEEGSDRLIFKIAYRFVDFLRRGRVRVPHNSDFRLVFPQGETYLDSNAEVDGVHVKITSLRTNISDDIWSVTIMLVNSYEEESSKRENCIFQPKICISTNNNKFLFSDNKDCGHATYEDAEELSLRLLYRNKHTYGTGLGVSVDWDVNENGMGSVWSEYIPESEIPPVSSDVPGGLFPKEKLSMKFFSDLVSVERDEKLSVLKEMTLFYSEWIDKLEKKVSSLDEQYIIAAERNISECKRAYERMQTGIRILSENENAFDAFTLANRAMFMQRIHLDFQKSNRKEDCYPGDVSVTKFLETNYSKTDDKYFWRPFQMGFILMDIESIVHENSQDRSYADLIWFPTGGGKTEAYLGLTAFTIFYRKLTNLSVSGGTAVIMRYTLRLLTAQQFSRASTLICACEFIRNDCASRTPKYNRYVLGDEPITIGLWIGSKHIPNKNEEAAELLNKLKTAKGRDLQTAKERYNKFQILKCPWCGTKMVKDEKNGEIMGKFGYNVGARHFFLFCPHEDCSFTNRLPIQIIDEELYKNPPTLLFGTVDKFAMLPWDGSTGAFFATNSSNRAPELIIQDELHLISGALGTITGLYETAIDAICGSKGVKPKIIASTATIRRAKEQCSALYNRESIQFPPPGLDAEDSFFAHEVNISHEHGISGRRYVGLMPSGKTKATTEVRIMAALLQNAYLMDIPDEIKDDIWTLTVYFSSLKDLGKASTLVGDDVKDSIRNIGRRLLTEWRPLIGSDELTSRVDTTELNETLDKLENVKYSQDRSNKRYASNVLLATNMISVGIDIDRLNVMHVVGQPKLTNEYIQASSRIGRSRPGTAFVQYDSTKSRDRSHYERFRSYHDSFYRFVEPTGVTPFSKPARDRGLHAVLISILRNRLHMFEDRDAGDFSKTDYEMDIEQAKGFIRDRVKNIAARSSSDCESDIFEIEGELDQFIEKWHFLAESSEKNDQGLCFGRKYLGKFRRKDDDERLLKTYDSEEFDTNATTTLISMRNVDLQVPGKMIHWEEE